MGMKPIASRVSGWCYVPCVLRFLDASTVQIKSAPGDWAMFDMPYGLTFAQFLDQYNACKEAIYFID